MFAAERFEELRLDFSEAAGKYDGNHLLSIWREKETELMHLRMHPIEYAISTSSYHMSQHQREPVLDAIVPRQYTDECVCDHTLHLLDGLGKRHGSWADQCIGGRWRVVCRCCGRFYGFHPARYEPKSTDLQTTPAR